MMLISPSTRSNRHSEESVNARFDNLTGKKFFMRQIVAPEGYALSEEIKEITVPANVSKLSIPSSTKLKS